MQWPPDSQEILGGLWALRPQETLSDGIRVGTVIAKAQMRRQYAFLQNAVWAKLHMSIFDRYPK
jgi:hypothetical protein